MSNYSRFSGFKEGESLPPNTYICVIKSERPALGGKKVKGERGVAYKLKDDPDNLYVIGNGWYWRGPRSETTAFESAYKQDPLMTSGSLTSADLERMLKQSMAAMLPYSSGYSSNIYTVPNTPMSSGDKITFKYHVDIPTGGPLPKGGK